MPNPTDPSDRTHQAVDRTAVRSSGEPPRVEPAALDATLLRTAGAGSPCTEPSPPPLTVTFKPARAAPASPGPGNTPPSGQAIRDLNDWIEQNRDAIDVGEYKLLHSLGTGAFGTVWEAHNYDTGERVAIKFLSAGDVRWEAMLDEVKFLQAMEGTHGIVTVKQVRRGTPGQPPYYVMPLANAGSLAEWLRAEGGAAAADSGPRARPRPALPVAEAVRIFGGVATALAAVHRRGIHHCDLKPRNILLHRVLPSDPVEPQIADFGQAHLATDDTPALGTFFYMPPDQADAALRKARSDSGWDVYALGAVLYEMLTGEPPRKSDELIADLRQTTHFETKLVKYRDQVRAAPVPTAHHRLADPLLAAVVDKCLDVDPARRPRDAGEVVDLLKHRAWWRQVRSLLALASVGTFLFVTLMAVVSWYAANKVTADTRENVVQEIDGSLTLSAWYGKNTVERTLYDHIAFIEHGANDCPPAVRQALAATAARVHPHGGSTAAAVNAIGDRQPFDQWLLGVHEQSARRWVDGDARSIALVLVSAGQGPAHGYTLSRVDQTRNPAADRTANARVYQGDWAFRDYFHGGGNRFDARGRPFPALRHTNISQTYRSTLNDRPWLVDITTPIWEDPARQDRVVGLLAIGLNVERQLKKSIEMPEELLGSGRREISRSVHAFVVNDRECWVWHEAGMKGLASAPTPRDPDNYAALARASARSHGGVPDDYVPWDNLESGLSGWTDRYVDPVQLHVDGQGGLKIAHTVPFRPYANSRYSGLKSRQWGFVVQVDEAVALRPLDRIRRDMLVAGSLLVATLAALSVVLWVKLFRLLRGWEFAGHG